MKYITLLLLLLVAGCPSGYDYGIDYETTELKAFQFEAEELAELILDHEISTTVYWTVTPCPTNEDMLTAVIYADKCYHGLTFDCDNIFVADRGKIGNSAFMHEIGHCFRLDMGLDGDAQHQDKAWWMMMDEINQEVRENDW